MRKQATFITGNERRESSTEYTKITFKWKNWVTETAIKKNNEKI